MSPSLAVPFWHELSNRHSHAFWQQKRVFITGASSGIGKALAEHLSNRGASVGLIARRQTELEKLTQQLQKQTSNQTGQPAQNIAWACADVTDSEGIQQAVQHLERKLGSCDVMIANAGIYRKTEVDDFDSLTQNAVIATNTQGVINTIAAVLPGMRQRKAGRIAVVASIAGMIGLPGAAAYSASKAAVISLFQSLRVDLHDYGIKATVAAPGFVDTPLITDEERETLKDLITAEQAAAKICLTIERDRAISWFPWPTWLVCRLLSLTPSGLYRKLVANIPDMEETAKTPIRPQTEGKS